MSNAVNLLVYVLPTVVGLITGENGTEIYHHLFALSTISLCLASIDRYYSTNPNALVRQRSSMKAAKISILIALFASLLLAIPELLYRGIDYTYGTPICTKISPVYNLYLTYFFNPVYVFLPIIVLLVFGILTYGNLKRVHRVNIVFNISNENSRQKKIIIRRKRIDRQFSTILILQILYFSLTTIPICIKIIYSTATKNFIKSDISLAIEGLFSAIAYVVSCAPFSSSFYIYYLFSSSYRQNLKKIIFKLSINMNFKY